MKTVNEEKGNTFMNDFQKKKVESENQNNKIFTRLVDGVY